MDKFKTYVIPIIALIIILGAVLMTCSEKRKYKELLNNYDAITDTVRIERLKNGDLLASKTVMQGRIKDLTEELGITKAELAELEKKVGKVEYITVIKTELRIDTLRMHDSIFTSIDRDTVYIRFDYSDDYIDLFGKTTVWDDLSRSQTELDEVSVLLNLTTGITEDNRIFIKSDNPYIQIKDIKGAQVTPAKSRRFGFGAYLGIGAQYGLIKKTIDVGPQLGVGLTYRIW